MTIFDGACSRRGYHINTFAKSLTTVAGRAAFQADPRGSMQSFGLTAEEIDLVLGKAWQELLERGAAIYLLTKMAIVQGGSLLDIGAQMRGEATTAPTPSRQATQPGRRNAD
jgi:protocatechuate 4,5-dioxygenase alpha subunit